MELKELNEKQIIYNHINRICEFITESDPNKIGYFDKDRLRKAIDYLEILLKPLIKKDKDYTLGVKNYKVKFCDLIELLHRNKMWDYMGLLKNERRTK